MKKKQLSLLLVMAMVLTLMLSACGGNPSGSNSSTPPASDPGAGDSTNETNAPAPADDGTVYKLEITHCNNEEDSMHVAASFFEQKVEELSNGRIDVVIYPNGTICGAAEEMTTILNGGIDGDFAITASVEAVNTLEGIFSIPFLLYADDVDTFQELKYRVYNDETIENLLEEGAKNAGFKRLGDASNSAGGLLFENNVRPVSTVADAQGLRIRTSGGSMLNLLMESFGCSSVTITGSELSMALSQGIADGVCSSIEWIHTGGNCTCKYVTMPAIFDFANPVYLSLDWWNNLPADLQEVMEQAMEETEVYIWDYATKNVKELMETIQGDPYNAEITNLNMDDPATAEACKNVMQAGIDEKIAAGGDAAKTIIDRIMEIKAEMGIESIG